MGKTDSKGGGGDGVEADGFRDCRFAELDGFSVLHSSSLLFLFIPPPFNFRSILLFYSLSNGRAEKREVILGFEVDDVFGEETTPPPKTIKSSNPVIIE
jgi:hypothetical protein